MEEKRSLSGPEGFGRRTSNRVIDAEQDVGLKYTLHKLTDTNTQVKEKKKTPEVLMMKVGAGGVTSVKL